MFGLVPSPADPRDHRLSLAAGSRAPPPPPACSLRDRLMAAQDQGDAPTCAACAAAGVLEVFDRAPGRRRRYFSRQFIYDSRANDSDGMTGRDACNILRRIGGVAERWQPYGQLAARRDRLEAKAAKHRLASYQRVRTPDEARRAIASGSPVLVGMHIYDEKSPMPWRPSVDGDRSLGGHAMLAVGYTAKGMELRNSWGPAWGDAGHAFMPWSQFDAIFEAWSFVDQEELAPQRVIGPSVLHAVLVAARALNGCASPADAPGARARPGPLGGAPRRSGLRLRLPSFLGRIRLNVRW